MISFSFRFRSYVAMLCLGILLILTLYLWVNIRPLVTPSINTPEQAAQKAILPPKINKRFAVEKCVQYGDAIIPHLATASQDFKYLYHGAVENVAYILAGINSPKSIALLNDLYHRDDPQTKEAGALGLVLSGNFKEQLTKDSFLVNDINEIKALTLANLGDKTAVPFLIETLATETAYWKCDRISKALGFIGDPSAIEPLRDFLRAPKSIALDGAFRGLIMLDDKEAIPLLIDRISPEIKDSAPGAISSLKQVTDVDFGRNREAWKAWWEANKRSFVIPESAVKEFRAEALR